MVDLSRSVKRWPSKPEKQDVLHMRQLREKFCSILNQS